MSITLVPDLLVAIDEIAQVGSSRSHVIEQAVREFLDRLPRQRRDARDLEILDRRVDEFNREMEDVLSYQVDL